MREATGIRVTHAGSILIESSRVPEFDACRALLALGITGKLEMWRPGKEWPDMQLDIEQGARLTVIETEDGGSPLRAWRPFVEVLPNAVSSRTVSPPTASFDPAAPSP